MASLLMQAVQSGCKVRSGLSVQRLEVRWLRPQLRNIKWIIDCVEVGVLLHWVANQVSTS